MQEVRAKNGKVVIHTESFDQYEQERSCKLNWDAKEFKEIIAQPGCPGGSCDTEPENLDPYFKLEHLMEFPGGCQHQLIPGSVSWSGRLGHDTIGKCSAHGDNQYC